jgi:hypothetical protein
MEVTGVLSVNNALEPQDIEVTPTNEDITIEPAEGCYIRSVVVKAIPNNGGGTGNDGGGTDSGNNG